MRYGLQIGSKFYQDGTAKKYPGNTVIADVERGNPAYAVIQNLREVLQGGMTGPCFIFLPDDSYHMTVIRGLNDYVRDKDFWPAALAQDMPMAQVDDYFEERVKKISMPEEIHMAFDQVTIDVHDVRICLRPWDCRQEEVLRSFRDQVADALGLRLPGHDSYTYHITLAYVLIIPEGILCKEVEERRMKMDALLKKQDDFWLTAPRIAFYNDMLNFYSQRITRT